MSSSFRDGSREDSPDIPHPPESNVAATPPAPSAKPLSYRGPVSGLKGLLTNRLAEGIASVVSSLDRATETSRREGGVDRIPLSQIYPAADQPRQVFDPKALEQLSQTMSELGQAQAITVRKTSRGYEIISGERRYRAAKLAGLSELDCVIKDCSPEEARLLALVENVQRQDLLPIEEAHYLKRVLSENSSLSLERLAKSLGSHKSTLSEKIQLTEVPEELQSLLYGKGRHLTHRHWRVISRIPEASFLRDMFVKAVEHQLSVVELERTLEAAGVSKTRPQRRSADSSSESKKIKERRIFEDRMIRSVQIQGNALRLKSLSVDLHGLSEDGRERFASELERVAKAVRHFHEVSLSQNLDK